jgi:hypothetical protein
MSGGHLFGHFSVVHGSSYDLEGLKTGGLANERARTEYDPKAPQI